MTESGYYPPGAEHDPNAPYNQVDVREKDFDIECECVLRRTVSVTTNDYVPEMDEENGHEYANTDNTDWGKAFKESGHVTVQECLCELRRYVIDDLTHVMPRTNRHAYLERVLEACDEWETVETSYTY